MCVFSEKRMGEITKALEQKTAELGESQGLRDKFVGDLQVMTATKEKITAQLSGELLFIFYNDISSLFWVYFLLKY